MRGSYLILLAVVLSSAYLANAKCCARGVWSSWAPSGSCSDSCGSCGKITYTRRCISARNGCPCSGPVRKTKHCNIMPCKYPRESCCGKMNAIVTGEKVICGPQPADRPEAPGPAPGTPCSAPPRPPPAPRPRTTKRIIKATTKAGPGGPPAGVTPECGPPLTWIDGELTQPDAKEKCEELGGNLAIIDSSAATQCVLAIATNSSQEASSAWIGLVDTAENSNHTADCTCWKWLDGSPYNYENFAPGQPNNAEEKEWCSEIFLPGSNYPAGTWNDELCEEYTRPAVCSVPANPTPTTGEATPAGPMKPSTPLALTASTQPKPSVTSTKTPATTAKTPSCPAGWDYCPEASRCHKLVDGGFTQPEAQSKCRELGGSLATVDSAAATQCLLDHAAKSSQEATSAWVGLVDTEETTNHTADCTCWKWLDGSTSSYENFAPGEPNNHKGKEWCTEFYLPRSNYPAGTWNDELCEGYTRPALCSVPANGANDPNTTEASTPTATTNESCPCEFGSTPATSPKPDTLPASSTSAPSTTSAVRSTTSTKTAPCPDGWLYCPLASQCYKLVEGGYTQPEAQLQCRALGGNLATIDSASATQCLLGYGAQTSAWIGLVDPTENSKHAANCTCWKWLDGSPYNYENFEPREPNNVAGKEWCTIVDLSQSSTSGKWLDWNCDGLSKPALCSVPTKPSTTPASTSPTPAERSTPSTQHASSEPPGPTPSTINLGTRFPTTPPPPCPLVDGGYTQPEAQSQCRALGGNLATVNSAASTQCVLDYSAQTSPNVVSAWIGLVDPTENGKHAANCTCWKWLDGSPYNYENFEPREPNNVGGKEWCTIVDLRQPSTSAGTWLDWNCGDLTVPALCSVPANGTKDTPTREPTRAAAKTTTRESSKPSTTPATPIPSVTSKLSTRRASPTTAETRKPSTPPASPTSAGPARLTTKSVTRASTKKAGPCPDDWAHCPGASQCYKFVNGEFTQPEAQTQCRALGADLATVKSVEATQCIVDYATRTSQEASSAWIGLVDKAENVNHTADCTCWKWLSGSPYNYENFATGQPNNGEWKEWCTEVYLRTTIWQTTNYPVGTWNDELCTYKRPALCAVPADGSDNEHKSTAAPTRTATQATTSGPFMPSTRPASPTAAATSKQSSQRPSTKPTAPPPPTSTKTAATTTKKPPCPAGWGYCPGASHCYKLVDGGYTQPEGQSQCRALGGNLATIDSAAANQCVLEYASKSSQKATTSAWIGLVDKTENSKHTANCTCWTWLDGSPFKYENFAPAGSAGFAKGQPNNQEGREWCSEIFLPGSKYPAGTWNDELCDGYKRPALCSVPASK